MTDPQAPLDLDRLLGAATVPGLSAGLIDRIVAEAQRPDRAVLPAAMLRRPRGRWTRRGVKSGIVAVSLMLATAVAAAFGGGALTFAKIQAVARHVVQHIRHPFHHAPAAATPMRSPVVHRMTVPSALIRTVPRGGVPMAAAHPLLAGPPVGRPMMADRGRARSALRQPEPFVHPERLRPAGRIAPHAARQPFAHRGIDRRFRAEPDRLRAAHFASRIGPAAMTTAPGRPGFRDRAAGFDGPRWRNPDGMGDGLRGPGWRRRMADGGRVADAPGWRRRGGLGPAGGGGRMRPMRPRGGRRPRRF